MIFANGKEDVKKWFEAHPKLVERVEGITIQVKHPETFAVDEVLDRQLRVDDIIRITNKGIFQKCEPGVYIWYYSMGVLRRSRLCGFGG